MATRKIKDAKDLSTQELIYFKGHAKATFMSDGATVEDAVRAVENATYKNKGYFPTLAELQSAFPKGSAGSRAYVGSTYPYSIYLWQNGAWVDSGATGGDESVDLASYYTKSETDTKLTELSAEINSLNRMEVGEFYQDGWMRYSDGLIAGSAGGAKLYIIRTSEIGSATKVFARVCVQDPTFAAIGFFTSDTPSQATYMAEASVQGLATSELRDFEAEIPEGCKSILVGNFSQLQTAYKIYVNSSKYLTSDSLIPLENKLDELNNKVETEVEGLDDRINEQIANVSNSAVVNLPVGAFENHALNTSTGGLANNYYAVRSADFISVEGSKTYKLSLSFPKSVGWIYFFAYNNETFISRDVVGSAQNVAEASIKIPASANQIKITTSAATTWTEDEIAAIKVSFVRTINEAIGDVRSELNNTKSIFEILDKSDLFSNVGFVAYSGAISTSSAYRYTNPIKVEKGDIYWISGSATSSVAVVAENQGEAINQPLSVIQRGSNDNIQEFVYVADKEKYVVFSMVSGATLHYLKNGSLSKSVLYNAANAALLPNAKFVASAKPNINRKENYLDLGVDPFVLSNNRVYEFKALMSEDSYRKIYFNANSSNLQILVFEPSSSSVSFKNYNDILSYDSIILGAVARGSKNGDIYDIRYHTFIFDYSVDGYVGELSNVAKIANSANNICDIANPYIYHFFMTGFNEYTLPTIGGQSLEDVAIAHRLGFKCIEANVHKTLDGNYVVTHGSAGNLGYAFEDLNGNLVNNVSIGSKTLAELQSNYRYRSVYPQYKTQIPSLEQFLRECKKQGLYVYVQYVDDAEMEIVRNVMGGHNFIQSFGTRQDGSYTAAYSDWDTLKTKILEADSNYMPMMDNALTESLLASGTLKEKIDEIHSLGRVVGYPASYATESVNQQTMAAGMDFSVAAYQVNDFVGGNIYAISADNGNFSDFDHNGSINEGVLNLANGNTFSKIAEKSYFLSKASLHIRFNGKLHIKLGEYIDEDFSSDGKTEMIFTTFFLDVIPQMVATSDGSTKIISATYNLSRC